MVPTAEGGRRAEVLRHSMTVLKEDYRIVSGWCGLEG
jgi:hypothetical protein